MRFLPTEYIVYKTNLKEEEIIKRISNIIIEPKQTFLRFFDIPPKPYEGKINGQTFKINRIISYRNSFLPRITGVIEKDFNQTIVKIQMRLHSSMIVFEYFWYSFCILLCIMSLIQTFIIIIHHEEAKLKDLIVPLIPFSMLIFGYTLTFVCFKLESSRSKKDLQALFEADIIQE